MRPRAVVCLIRGLVDVLKLERVADLIGVDLKNVVPFFVGHKNVRAVLVFQRVAALVRLDLIHLQGHFEVFVHLERLNDVVVEHLLQIAVREGLRLVHPSREEGDHEDRRKYHREHHEYVLKVSLHSNYSIPFCHFTVRWTVGPSVFAVGRERDLRPPTRKRR